MKWFILICLIIGTKLSESKNLFKRDADKITMKNVFPVYHQYVMFLYYHIIFFRTLIMLAQNLQKCPLEDLQKVVVKIHDFAKHCEDHSEEEECGKPINVFYSALCAIPGLNSKYDWAAECCGKEEAERKDCFIEKRHVDLELPVRPPKEELCKQFKENPQDVFYHRRETNILPPAVIGLAKDYLSILAACCGAENLEQCYIDRKTLIYLKMYPLHRKLAELTREFPNIKPAIAYEIAGDIAHMHQDCCHGDLIECLSLRLELTNYTCEHRKEISPKLESCCTKPLLERVKCILDLENNDPPTDLPNIEGEFIDNPKVCERLAVEKDAFLASFLHAFVIGHPELSPAVCAQVANEYQLKLVKCCKEENPPECLKSAPANLEIIIKESKDTLQKNCDAQAQLGDHPFAVVYAKRFPQLDVNTLADLANVMVDIGRRCCALDEKHKMACADELFSYVTGDLCATQKKTFINANLAGCCSGPYTHRRRCIINLDADPNYVPPPVDENTFHIDESLCTASAEQLLKEKLSEKLPQAAEAFQKLQEKCCAAPDRPACFATEVQNKSIIAGYFSHD
uniref:Albumin domain-containing protein n=1 Tax=Leptobrachium leishanense TaxID=445787 RepID=A0A8C5LNC7_9ANUR